MTRLLEICLATIALLFVSTSAAPAESNQGMDRHTDEYGRPSSYYRDDYEDEEEYEGGRYYDYEGGDEWDYSDDEDYRDGGNYDNEDADNGEDDYYGYRRDRHEA
jgi:hypothetical protein